MGMFDYIRCEAPLPETPLPPPDELQTKDTPDQYLTTYTITADGRLTWRPYDLETVPPEEREFPNPAHPWHGHGSVRRVERDEEDVPFHGDICFYGGGREEGWWEYTARFTDGRLTRIMLDRCPPPAPRPPTS